jgi:phospho-N-acetylmuramoyl-pentapeptide-transferase
LFYLIARALSGQDGALGALRVLEYVSVRSIGAAVTTLLLVVLISPAMIRMLHRRGSSDRQRSFDAHLGKSKTGTPTMGGLVILASLLLSMALWCDPASPFVWVLAASLAVFGSLGAADDLAKLRGRGADDGLSRPAKVAVQGGFGLLLGLFLYLPSTTPFPAGLVDTIGIPFLKPAAFGGADVHLGWFYIPFVAFVVVAISNAVNLIDGLDGLAAGTTIPTALVYGVFAYVLSNARLSGYLLYSFLPGVEELVVFAAALIGALVGFLWYNSYPAEVFMGDTGSLSLGGLLAAMVVLTKQELLFVMAGGLFIFVNVTHLIGDRIGIHMLGRRIFYRTPIHHSFEHMGISEPKIVLRLVTVALVLAAVSLATIKLR